MNDIHSNADAYVLGVLEPSEAAEFEQHLTGCSDCRQEVASAREIAARLSDFVATDPPASLRASVLAQVATTAQDAVEPSPVPRPGRHASAVPPAEASAFPPAEASPAAADVVPIRRSWTTRVSALVAAAAVVGAIAVGGWAIQSRNDAHDDAATAQEQIEQLASVLGATDVQTASAVAAGGGIATVIRSADQGVAVLVGSDLPTLPNDQVYEAWTFKGETAVPAGTFTPDSSETTHELPSAGVDTSTVALTIEPEGGSDTPTTPPIAVIDLT
jgi:anti-sigma factor RsiW